MGGRTLLDYHACRDLAKISRRSSLSHNEQYALVLSQRCSHRHIAMMMALESCPMTEAKGSLTMVALRTHHYLTSHSGLG